MQKLRILLYVVLWYFFSTSLRYQVYSHEYTYLITILHSLYNKMLVSKSHLSFPYPLLTAALHSTLHLVLASLTLFWGYRHESVLPSLIPTINPYHESSSVPTEQHGRSWSWTGVLCGFAGALDIGLSNASMIFITLSFYTMVKSTVSLWVMLLAFWFGLERPQYQHFVFIAVIVTGAILTVEGETQFDARGFTLVMLATIMSALRWALTQVLLSSGQIIKVHGKSLKNTLILMRTMTPYMTITLLLCSYIMEFGGGSSMMRYMRGETTTDGPAQNMFHMADDYNLIPLSSNATSLEDISISTRKLTNASPWLVLGAMSFGGLLAFLMTLAEYALVQTTDVLTLCMAGIVKECVVLLSAVIVYGDEFGWMNGLGLFVSIAGIFSYQVWRSREKAAVLEQQYELDIRNRFTK